MTMSGSEVPLSVDDKPAKTGTLSEKLREAVKLERDNLILITLVLVFVAALGVVWVLNSGTQSVKQAGISAKAGGPGKSTSLKSGGRTEVVAAQLMKVTVKSSGEVKALKSVPLLAPMAGRIVALPVAIGAKVTSGTVVVRLDSGGLQRRVDQAKAKYDLAQAQVEKLRQTPNTAPADLKIAQINADIAKIEHEGARADLASADVKAPTDGVLDVLSVVNGQTIGANLPLGSMVASDGYVVEGWVTQTDVSALQLDTTGSVVFASKPHEAFSGRIKVIGISANRANPPGIGMVPVQLKLEGDQDFSWLRTGLQGVRLELPGTKRVFSVSKNSVVDQGVKKIVFVVRPDKELEQREVKVGLASENKVEIIEGLREGETVALNEL